MECRMPKQAILHSFYKKYAHHFRELTKMVVLTLKEHHGILATKHLHS